MKALSGQRIAVGDRVKLHAAHCGTVVCSIDTGEFTSEYPKAEWGYLKTGILVRTDDGDLFHYTEPDEDFELIRPSAAS